MLVDMQTRRQTHTRSLVSADEKPQDMSLSISTNGNASITVSVEVNGTLYSGWYTTPKQHTTHSLWLTHEALNRCRGQALNRAASS